MTEKLLVFLFCLSSRGDVLSRNNEDVHRRNGLDVGERVAQVVLVDRLRRNASIDDLAKEAAHGQLRVYRTEEQPPASLRFGQGSTKGTLRIAHTGRVTTHRHQDCRQSRGIGVVEVSWRS